MSRNGEGFWKGVLGAAAIATAFLRLYRQEPPVIDPKQQPPYGLDASPAPQVAELKPPEPTVNLDSYVGLQYSNADISKVTKVKAGQPIPPPLEDIVDLMEGRDHLFYVELKDGKGLLVKPYKSSTERDVLAKLRDSGITLVLGYSPEDNGKGYFAEEIPAMPSIERALESHHKTLPEVTGLLGEALYRMHSRGVTYNGRFNSHVFVQPYEKRVKVRDFSHATLSLNPNDLISELVRALNYINFLAASYNIEELEFLRAISGFRVGYYLHPSKVYQIHGDRAHLSPTAEGINFNPEDMLKQAIARILSDETTNSIASALNKLINKPKRVKK